MDSLQSNPPPQSRILEQVIDLEAEDEMLARSSGLEVEIVRMMDAADKDALRSGSFSVSEPKDRERVGEKDMLPPSAP